MNTHTPEMQAAMLYDEEQRQAQIARERRIDSLTLALRNALTMLEHPEVQEATKGYGFTAAKLADVIRDLVSPATPKGE